MNDNSLLHCIASQNVEAMLVHIAPILVLWAVVVVAMVADFISGVRKAVQNGQARTSIGLRQSCEKAGEYFPILLFALLGDIMLSLVVSIPAFTLLAAGFLVYVEFTSVREKADVKQRKRRAKLFSEYTEILNTARKEDIVELLKKLKNETD